MIRYWQAWHSEEWLSENFWKLMAFASIVFFLPIWNKVSNKKPESLTVNQLLGVSTTSAVSKFPKGMLNKKKVYWDVGICHTWSPFIKKLHFQEVVSMHKYQHH